LYIGIDFSINSPAICIRSEKLKFVGFYNEEGKNFKKGDPKDYIIHRELSEMEEVEIVNFKRRKKHENYTIDQAQKIEDSQALADLILQKLPDSAPVGLEGYSYSSKGNSFIDLIAFNSVLRNNLWRKGHAVSVFTPSQVKTMAGKGNLNKQGMFLAFVDNKTEDPLLENSRFWKWCSERRDLVLGEIPKPVDDLVDSYWISRLLARPSP
jgi:hypothetical protein